MEQSRRDFLKYAVVGVAAAGIVAVGGSAYYEYGYLPSQKPQTTDLSIGLLHSPSELAVVVAHEVGFFKKYGLNSNLLSFSNPGAQTDALLTGRIDLTHQAVATFIIRAFALNDYSARLVTPTAWTGTYQGHEYKLTPAMLRADLVNVVKSIRDLKGRTIATLGAGTFDYGVAQILLTEAGLNPNTDVNFVYMSFAKMVEAFSTKSIDFSFNVPPPFSLELLRRKYAALFKDPSYIPTGDVYVAAIKTDRVPVTGLWATENFLSSHSDACKFIVRGVTDAVAWMQSNQDKTAEIAAKWTELSTDLTKEALNDIAFIPYTPGFTEWQKYLSPVMNAMIPAGIIKRPVEISRLVTTPCFTP